MKRNEIEDAHEDFNNKCFVIMPISDQPGYPDGHFTKIYEQIFKPAIIDSGLEPYRVDENKLSEPIMVKIFEAIQNCPMAICDLSSRNPNVLYELGLRQAYDKPVILVQDEKTDRIFDVSGINTYTYQSNRLFENVISAKVDITAAIVETKDSGNKSWSLVKLLNTREAVLKKEEVTSEDEQDFLLRTIMARLDGIEKSIQYKSYEFDLDRKRELHEQELQNTLNKSMNRLFEIYMQTVKDLEVILGRKPTMEEVGDKTNIPIDMVIKLNNMAGTRLVFSHKNNYSKRTIKGTQKKG